MERKYRKNKRKTTEMAFVYTSYNYSHQKPNAFGFSFIYCLIGAMQLNKMCVFSDRQHINILHISTRNKNNNNKI